MVLYAGVGFFITATSIYLSKKEFKFFLQSFLLLLLILGASIITSHPMLRYVVLGDVPKSPIAQ